MIPATTPHTILCLNSGSSSLKFALYRIEQDQEALLMRGLADRIGFPGGRLYARDGDNRVTANDEVKFANHAAACQAIMDVLSREDTPQPQAIGHRVVHGGPNYAAPQRVDAALLSALRDLIRFAPLHLPSALTIMEALGARHSEVPQVACFDTAFHRRMPEVAQRLPLPSYLWDQGVRRYGFHGLSYEFILESLGTGHRGRTVIAHLGNGASMAAVMDGRPVDTTMSFTPTSGLVMGTRCGDLDPGAVIYLMRERGYGPDELNDLLNFRSGLVGVSGFSSDMKTLLEHRENAPSAAMAVSLFCYQARKFIGALAAAMGGLDLLVFTGGIGERAAPVRFEICQALEFLGVQVDERRNAAGADVISATTSRCAVRVIPTNEELMIARHTTRLLHSDGVAKP
ncbi:MAG: acetate/propionate family kinase [Verrucomicrobia bacterium]|nr:acetate/propionate family kinase [Verrucomicrobiota bacterium]